MKNVTVKATKAIHGMKQESPNNDGFIPAGHTFDCTEDRAKKLESIDKIERVEADKKSATKEDKQSDKSTKDNSEADSRKDK